MEAYLDALAAFLSTDAGTRGIYWVLGDIGMGAPPGWPFGLIIAYDDVAKSISSGPHGVDDDTYTIDVLIVDGPLQYGDAVQTAGTGYYEVPGYRKLLQLAQATRSTLRANITLGGVGASSEVGNIRNVGVQIDKRMYRGARIRVTAKQRRQR
ncbi:MAG TPA: hypothetical protein VFF79_12805 [Conexibacter sp.]|nr:hypothetical protein [Conexibacter sp.]